MPDIIVHYTAVGFGISLILFFIGQGARLLCEIIEHFAK